MVRRVLIPMKARWDVTVRQQELVEVRLGTEPHEHLYDEAVTRLRPVAAGILVSLRALLNSIQLPHHVYLAGADGGACDRGAPVLSALPANQQRGLGVTETTLALVRDGLFLQAAGFYGDAAGAELAHRVVLGAGQQRVVRLNDDV